MATSEQLSEYLCEHYRYEVNMLRFSFWQLHVTTGLERNAMLETCALHARVLRDFYTKSKDEDRGACEYGVTELVVPEELKADFRLVDKQIAHMDKKRPFGQDLGKLTSVRLRRLVRWLTATHDQFISECEPSARLAGTKGCFFQELGDRRIA